MVVPGLGLVNDTGESVKGGVGGWLLLLCLLLLVGQPVSLALGASTALDAVPIRGLSLALVIIGRTLVAAIGVGAGLALLGRRAGAVTFARWSLVLSAAMDTFVYVTPFYPSNRTPGVTPFFVVASLVYYAIWLAYLFRSRRVRSTFPA